MTRRIVLGNCAWFYNSFSEIYDYCLLEQMLKSDHQVRLLIVDSISSLIAPILGGSGPQGIVHLCMYIIYFDFPEKRIIMLPLENIND